MGIHHPRLRTDISLVQKKMESDSVMRLHLCELFAGRKIRVCVAEKECLNERATGE